MNQQIVSPFNMALKVLSGQAPDLMIDGPQDPVPEDCFTVSLTDERVKMLGMQALLNQELFLKDLQTDLPDKSGNKEEHFFRKLERVGARGAVISLLQRLFWEGVECTIPKGDCIVGAFGLYQDWTIASPFDKTITLSDVRYTGSAPVQRFFGTFMDICGGKHIYDDVSSLPERQFDEPVVGTLESPHARQLYMMLVKYHKARASHDPYPSFGDEIIAFRGEGVR
jgi:hypothetical protein